MTRRLELTGNRYPMGLKIDLGCGSKKREGFLGVDKIRFDGVDYVCDLGNERLPFADNTIEEAYASHFVEHLTATQRVFLVNEVHRVLIPKGFMTIICPYWGSSRAYGDPTHQWPPVSDFWFLYLDRKWRMENAPHTDQQHWDQGYACDFECTWGYNLHGDLLVRNNEFQQFAATFYKEAIQDIHATITKK